LRREIPGEDFEQKIRNPNYIQDDSYHQTRISQEEIDTKYRNFQKKEIQSSMTIDSDHNKS